VRSSRPRPPSCLGRAIIFAATLCLPIVDPVLHIKALTILCNFLRILGFQALDVRKYQRQERMRWFIKTFPLRVKWKDYHFFNLPSSLRSNESLFGAGCKREPQGVCLDQMGLSTSIEVDP
jgi:hypothetical protein